MAARAYWKGFLRLSLVTVGVELYSAVARSRALEMHQIHEPSGQRVRYQKTAPGVGPVPNEEIVKGVEVGDDEYVVLDSEELDAIKLESKRSIDLVQFVDHAEIDPRYFERPFYVTPAADEIASEGFAVLREALKKTRKTALGQMAVRGRDNIVAINPCGKGLLLETLRYEDEVKQSDAVFADMPEMKVDKELVALAEELIGRKSKPFDPGAFRSEYEQALKALIQEKRAKGAVSMIGEDDLPDRRGNVIDLMEALKRSVRGDDAREKGGAKRPPARRPAAKATKKRASR